LSLRLFLRAVAEALPEGCRCGSSYGLSLRLFLRAVAEALPEGCPLRIVH